MAEFVEGDLKASVDMKCEVCEQQIEYALFERYKSDNDVRVCICTDCYVRALVWAGRQALAEEKPDAQLWPTGQQGRYTKAVLAKWLQKGHEGSEK